MCKVYNSLGSLMDIKAHLRSHNVNEFKSVKELINFQNNYSVIRQQIISNHSDLIKNEKKTLSEEIAELNDLIKARKTEVEQELQLEIEHLQEKLDQSSSSHNILQRLIGYWRRASLRKKIRTLQYEFDSKIAQSVEYLTNTLTTKNHRYEFIVYRFDDAVSQSSLFQLGELARKKKIVDQANSSIYGALGEQKVVKELESLPDDYILVNNFRCLFDPPVYYNQNQEKITTVQIDHLLVSPSGIFLIETKNWSQQSIDNVLFRSPIEQVRRANFVLFKLLAEDNNRSNSILTQHHWGSRKIPIRNTVVLINQKPNQEFQYVKVLTLKELVSYVKYFQPLFSSEEIQRIANHLLRINGQIVDGSKI